MNATFERRIPEQVIAAESVTEERAAAAAGADVPVLVRRTAAVRAVPQHGFLQAFQSLLYVITVALFIITFIAQPFRIPSESMVPTLLVGDFLLVDKQVGPEPGIAALTAPNTIHRGDLIVFHYPVDPSLHLVKRVVAVPGDRIHLHDGRVVLNGRAIAEPYAIFRPAAEDSYRDEFPRFTAADPGVDSRWWIEMRSLVSGGELTIPPGNYFVLGDNRNDSEDSRYWGLVPDSAVVGKPLLVYFSLSNSKPMPGQSFAAALPGVGASSAQMERGPNERPDGESRLRRVLHVIR